MREREVERRKYCLIFIFIFHLLYHLKETQVFEWIISYELNK